MGKVSIEVTKEDIFILARQLGKEEKQVLVDILGQEISASAQVVPEPVTSNKEKYLEERNKVYDYSQEQFDKNVLYISSSALALTLVFIEKIVKITDSRHKFYLWVGWALLGGTILLYLLSHLLSAYFQKWVIKKVEDLKNIPDVKENEGVKKLRKRITFVIRTINLILYVGLATGIIYIMLFLYYNLL
jgi:hypothetical protein